jgi:hypothetical protein
MTSDFEPIETPELFEEELEKMAERHDEKSNLDNVNIRCGLCGLYHEV